jgi:hypothetical protein
MMAFPSMAAFLAYWTTRPAVAKDYLRRGIADGAAVIRDDAKGRLGRYDGNQWAPLAERTKDQRERLGFAPDDPELRTGRLRDNILSSAEDGRAAVGVPDAIVGGGSVRDPVRNIGEVALWQEVGTNAIPARPFLGPAAQANGRRVAEHLGRSLAAALAGRNYEVPRR